MHSLSHALGGINPKLHHGTLNAIFLPAVVHFNANAPTVRDERKLERLRHAMGLEAGANIGAAIEDMTNAWACPPA